MTNDIKIYPVAPADFITHWSTVEPLLNKALTVALQRYLAIDVLALMIQGQGQGWFISEDNKILAIMVTKVEQFPRRRGLIVFALAGARMTEWFAQAEEILTAHARRFGCDHFECQGRKGWERVLELEPRATFLVKDLLNNVGGADV
ncbi:MAG TPA: hypothetical protein VHY35_10450 [Stellaceae bacterium]|jgi:hypothetical protein|nr:hypothetical protein [Stellaceae bacterium]